MEQKVQLPKKEEQIINFAISRIDNAIYAFYLWKRLNLSININSVGKELAKKNVKIINKYSPFFHTVLASLPKSFIVDLSIFFDSGKQSENLHLKTILGILKNKIED